MNEVVFSVTSLDVLFHLRNQEFFRPCGEILHEGEMMDESVMAKDIMSRTCRHLLRQRRCVLSGLPRVPPPTDERVTLMQLLPTLPGSIAR